VLSLSSVQPTKPCVIIRFVAAFVNAVLFSVVFIQLILDLFHKSKFRYVDKYQILKFVAISYNKYALDKHTKFA
jgi:undecaprenyl pyrophosphate phosphatase UppP